MKPICHQLCKETYYVPNWPIKHLFLGTFNPEGGEKVPYYYGRVTGERDNKTWKLLSEIFNTTFDPRSPLFFDELQYHRIGCMDLIQSVEIDESKTESVKGKGYKDTIIINNKVKRIYNTSDIQRIIANNPGVKIYSTWGKGPSLKNWTTEVSKIENIIKLVSPSMAARVPKGANKFEYMMSDWKSKIII